MEREHRAARPRAGAVEIAAADAVDGSAEDRPAATGVRINGHELDPDAIAALRETYGVDPAPGDYWYDARSGIFGVMGHGGLGFMLPGHDFGPLDPACSAGATGVVVNSRVLPQGEWMMWSSLIGVPIQPGRYWLDANGNAGIEGNPIPSVNFVQAAAMSGGMGGGSDIWSTRFSSGGWDQGGRRGYVQLPDGGFAGYGF